MFGLSPQNRLTPMARTLFGIICAALCLLPVTALACKYSVRDVGFVDLGSQPYHLYCFLDGRSPAGYGEEFLRSAKLRFADSNVIAEVVDVAADPNHPALRYRQSSAANNSPEIVLVAADPELSPLSLRAPTIAAMNDQLNRLVSSPARDEIWNTIVDAYAVVVVVQGESPDENRRADSAARFAIKQLNGIMAKLDKPVETPPQLTTISAANAARERVLLWSWGLDTDERAEASVVILFGRGRRLGPVFTGSDISGTELFDAMTLVGKSCECDLDRSWMQGPMFPHAWDANRQADVTRALGFDAENPLVKVEISRILARGAQNRAAKDAVDVIAIDPLLGYGEFDVDELPPDDGSDSPDDVPLADSIATKVANLPPEDAAPATTAATVPAEPQKQSNISADDVAVTTFGFLAVLALSGGLYLLYRRRGEA